MQAAGSRPKARGSEAVDVYSRAATTTTLTWHTNGIVCSQRHHVNTSWRRWTTRDRRVTWWSCGFSFPATWPSDLWHVYDPVDVWSVNVNQTDIQIASHCFPFNVHNVLDCAQSNWLGKTSANIHSESKKGGNQVGWTFVHVCVKIYFCLQRYKK